MPTTLARGPTARSAASPRLPPQNPSSHRRTVSRQGQPSLPISADAHQALVASLKQETDEKERVGSHFYNSSFPSFHETFVPASCPAPG